MFSKNTQIRLEIAKLRLYAWILKKLLKSKRVSKEMRRKGNDVLYIVDRLKQWDKQKPEEIEFRDADIDILKELGVLKEEDLK